MILLWRVDETNNSFTDLFNVEVDVGTHGAMMQRLGRPEVVAQRRLGVLGVPLHETA